MVRKQSSRAHASEKANRKQAGENGHPQTPPTPEQKNAANRTKTTVRHSLKCRLQETERATGGPIQDAISPPAEVH